MHLNFWLYKSKQSKKGLAPIYLRITLGKEKTEVSAGVSISPNNWNSRKGLVKGSSESAKELNKKLQHLKETILEIYNNLVTADLPLSVEVIKSKLLRNTDQRISLLYAISYHNELFKKKVGIEKCRATYIKFETLKSKLIIFLQYEYKRNDLFLKELAHQFMVKFESYLKVENRIAHNTAMKYIQQLKKIIHMDIAHGWMERNPFYNFRCSFTTVNRGYLTLSELNILQNKHFSIKRLEDVRNLFLFSCYTGLAYSDVKCLTNRHFLQKEDGSQWVIMYRRKTVTRSPIPLLIQAEAILKNMLMIRIMQTMYYCLYYPIRK